MFHYDSAGPKHRSGWKPIKKTTYALLLKKHKEKAFLTAEQVKEYEGIVGEPKKNKEPTVQLPQETIAQLKKLGIDWKG